MHSTSAVVGVVSSEKLYTMCGVRVYMRGAVVAKRLQIFTALLKRTLERLYSEQVGNIKNNHHGGTADVAMHSALYCTMYV